MNREARGRERSLAVATLLLLGACPWMLARHQLSLLTELLILGLFALSLDLIMGYTGMVSFGHAAYFGLGAYGLVLSIVLCRGLVRSPFGRALQAIRENERKFSILGQDPRRFKLIVFVIAAVFAGLAGALFAPFRGFASPEVMFWVL